MIAPFLARLRAVCQELPAYGFEFLFVDDGSEDGTNMAILEQAADDSRVRLITLSRNFGHQRAITAGTDLCAGDYAVVIDADLQDPPECIPEILRRLDEGYDLVHMVRASRAVDTFLKRFSARLFYAVMHRWILPELPENAPDFKGFNRAVLEAFRCYRERIRFMRGILATLGFRQTRILYTREARFAGVSKYPSRKVLALARDAMVSFSVIPLRLSFVAGAFAGAATALFTAGCALAYCLGRLEEPILMLLITLVGGFSSIILMVLGAIGEYLGCLVREAKQRPLYIIRSIDGKEPESLKGR